ncbi:MAG: hypothetical protein AB8G05_25945 [Oligoflexales bacterium]
MPSRLAGKCNCWVLSAAHCSNAVTLMIQSGMRLIFVRVFFVVQYVGSNLQLKILENAKQPRAILLLTTIVNDEKEHTSIGLVLQSSVGLQAFGC